MKRAERLSACVTPSLWRGSMCVPVLQLVSKQVRVFALPIGEVLRAKLARVYDAAALDRLRL